MKEQVKSTVLTLHIYIKGKTDFQMGEMLTS